MNMMSWCLGAEIWCMHRRFLYETGRGLLRAEMEGPLSGAIDRVDSKLGLESSFNSHRRWGFLIRWCCIFLTMDM